MGLTEQPSDHMKDVRVRLTGVNTLKTFWGQIVIWFAKPSGMCKFTCLSSPHIKTWMLSALLRKNRQESIEIVRPHGNYSMFCLLKLHGHRRNAEKHHCNDENDGHAVVGRLGMCCCFCLRVRGGWDGVASSQKCFRGSTSSDSDWITMWTPEMRVNAGCKCMWSGVIRSLKMHFNAGCKGGLSVDLLHSSERQRQPFPKVSLTDLLAIPSMRIRHRGSYHC